MLCMNHFAPYSNKENNLKWMDGGMGVDPPLLYPPLFPFPLFPSHLLFYPLLPSSNGVCLIAHLAVSLMIKLDFIYQP